MSALKIPDAPKSIQKGFPLKLVLDKQAVTQLAENLHFVYAAFEKSTFIEQALTDIRTLGIKERSEHIAKMMRNYLPDNYSAAIDIILASLTPPLQRTEGNGLAIMFYMPHCSFIANYGLDANNNGGVDPFDISMNAQYELTKRFTCEYSIRPFIVHNETRTMDLLYQWMHDDDPHVRRLCSEGTRPRLPWSKKIDSFVNDPSPCLAILEQLKNDADLYIRRSVANHVGDIAKDHLDLALTLCENWLVDATKEVKWLIRHAVRNPVKKGNERAITIRKAAK
ncbi:MAG: DNA alkylation repair protein [Gammaproteobacteria bacterium]|nr:MAG: DNA alkylation repair protein [Gammaproteobacteria bacterium]